MNMKFFYFCLGNRKIQKIQKIIKKSRKSEKEIKALNIDASGRKTVYVNRWLKNLQSQFFQTDIDKKICSSIPISSEDAAAASTVSLSAEVQKLLMDDSDSKENE